jgi:peptidoglycan L-alanyl-D-glutamate endopeptidase CwlK
MYSYSRKSRIQLRTCDHRLREIFNEVIKVYDCSIVQGYRGKEDQNRAFEEGKSQLRYPESNHNQLPSKAVDVIPYPSGYEDIGEFFVLATHVFAVANRLGYKVRWGGHWKSFKDYPHWEIIDDHD